MKAPEALTQSKKLRVYLSVAMGVSLVALFVMHSLFAKVASSTQFLDVDLKEMAQEFDNWRSIADDTLPEGVVDWIGLDDWLLRAYKKENQPPVWLYIGYIGKEDFVKGKMQVGDHHSPRICYPGQGWQIVDEGLEQIEVAGGGLEITVDRLLVRQGDSERAILYWFMWGEKIVAEGNRGDYAAKLARVLQFPSLLFENQRTDKSFVRISAPVIGSPEATFNRQIEFIKAAFPALAERFQLNLANGQETALP